MSDARHWLLLCMTLARLPHIENLLRLEQCTRLLSAFFMIWMGHDCDFLY